MLVKEFMTCNLNTISADASAFEAKQIMKKQGVPYLLVINNGKVVGAITRESLKKAFSHSPDSIGKSQGIAVLAKQKVTDIMENVITVWPDTPVEHAMILGQEHGVSVFPVVKDHKLIGAVTITDFLRNAPEVFGPAESKTLSHLLVSCKTCNMADIFEVVNKCNATLLSILHSKSPIDGKDNCIIHLGTGNREQLSSELKKKRKCGIEMKQMFIS